MKASDIFIRTAEVVIFVSAIIIMYVMADLFLPQVNPISLKILNDKIRFGDIISYETNRSGRDGCKLEYQRFIIKEGDVDTFYTRDVMPGVPIQSDAPGKSISFMRPTFELPPGTYVLQIYAISACSLISRVFKFPDARFEVVE